MLQKARAIVFEVLAISYSARGADDSGQGSFALNQRCPS